MALVPFNESDWRAGKPVLLTNQTNGPVPVTVLAYHKGDAWILRADGTKPVVKAKSLRHQATTADIRYLKPSELPEQFLIDDPDSGEVKICQGAYSELEIQEAAEAGVFWSPLPPRPWKKFRVLTYSA